MQTWEAFAICGGIIIGVITFWSAITKVIMPAMKVRDRFKKVDQVDKNSESISLLDGRVGKLEGYQIKNYESICRIEANVDLIGRGVLSLINNRLTGNSIDGLQAVKNDMESKRGFVK